MSEGWYDRPFVKEINAIFGHPKPPERVTQLQFDNCRKQLENLSQLPWHEIKRDHYWYYQLDLAYQPLQQDLFDYLFPAWLIFWREGLLSRLGGPHTEMDFYTAGFMGNVFVKMMNHDRRRAVFDWMVDGFLEAVDSWSGELDFAFQGEDEPDHHQFFLHAFHAIGQCIPIVPDIWERLANVNTSGRAQFWFVLATGLAYPFTEVPNMEPWTLEEGGGGIFMQATEATMCSSGYLDPPNLTYVRSNLTLGFLVEKLTAGAKLNLQPSVSIGFPVLIDRLTGDDDYPRRKLAWFLDCIGQRDLGGMDGFEGELRLR